MLEHAKSVLDMVVRMSLPDSMPLGFHELWNEDAKRVIF